MSGLSGTNSYMGDDPSTNIFNSPLANAPPDAEEDLDIDLGDDFPDIILTPMSKPKPTEISNTVAPIKDDSPINLQVIEKCVESTHVFNSNKTEENPKVIENETEPKTNSLATENFSKNTQVTSQKDLKSFNINEIIVKGEKRNNTQATIEIKNDPIINIKNEAFYLVKANHEKKEFKIVHHEKIAGTLLKNDPNVFVVTANGIPIMTAEQKELHKENLALYSFSIKNTSSLNLENFRKNFNQDNIFVCSNDQFNILNNKLMKQTADRKEKKDEKHVNSNDKESQILEKSDKSIKSSTVSTIDLIKNSMAGIFTSSTRKTDSAKEEQAIQKRDQKKFREKKEMLEKETNKMIIEGINRKVQEKNKPKH